MKFALWFVISAAIVLGIWMIWGGCWEEQFTLEGSVQWLEKSGPWAWAAGLILLVSDFVLPVPGTIVISALGYIYGTLIGGLIASIGLMLAGLLGYGIGRLFTEKLARRWLGDHDYEKGKLIFEKCGGWAVALSRAVPILPEVISCTAGLVKMPFRRFLVSLACGSLPVGFLFAAIGKTGHEMPGLAFLMSLLAPAILWWIAKSFR